MVVTRKLLQKKKAKLDKGKSMMPMEDDMDWYTDEIEGIDNDELIAYEKRHKHYEVSKLLLRKVFECYCEITQRIQSTRLDHCNNFLKFPILKNFLD
ncbi:hypothetical protein Tco_1250699, partial [Tanacetum coccineum]